MGNLNYPVLSRWGLNLFWQNSLPTSLKFKSKSINLKYLQLETAIQAFSEFGFRHDNLNRNRRLNYFIKTSLNGLNRSFFLTPMRFKDFFNDLTYLYSIRTHRSTFVKSKFWMFAFQDNIVIVVCSLPPLVIESFKQRQKLTKRLKLQNKTIFDWKRNKNDQWLQKTNKFASTFFSF